MNDSPSEAAESAQPHIEVCVGCGGVGKTTVAAMLAIEAARRGNRTLVLTIDPARRLADALGVQSLSGDPQPIPRATLEALGVPSDGSLCAMMLDMKRTFDDLVTRFAESAEARQRIFDNPIYQHVSDTLAGSVEYSAMEKLYEMATSGAFDWIVLDTPPSQHALDFLEAPRRLLEFLDSRLVNLLIHPALAAGRFGFRLFHSGTHHAMKLLERITGIGFLEDLSEFLLAFEGMSEGFKVRAGRVRELLIGPRSSFVLITTPERESVSQALEFLNRLEAFQVPLGAVIANRVLTWPEAGDPPADASFTHGQGALRDALAAHTDDAYPADAAARAAAVAAAGYASRVRRDERALEPLRRRNAAAGRRWGCIPELPEDVRDLEGLARMGRIVFAEDRGPA